MSVPSAELTAPTIGAPDRAASGSVSRRLDGWRLYGVLALGALVIGALSLLIPSTPSYDPWAWIVWGREIVHFNLQTTGGPTWKPLPVLFTTAFAPFGSAAPDLWLVVGRAGAVMSVLMVFRVASRLTMWLGEGLAATGSRRDRITVILPALFAGAIGAVALVFSGAFIKDNALGYSEGLMTALVLIALERHLDGHHRQAFAVGFFAALDRPEIWLFWGPYGLWLFWKDPGARKLVIALFVLIPVLWFLPEYWGSGHFLRGVSRAQNPRSNSPAFASCPFCKELNNAWVTVLSRIKIAAGIGVIAGVVLLIRGLRRRFGPSPMSWRLASNRERAQAVIVLTGLAGLGWWVVIAILTQAGFSGNNRYLVLGAALIEIAGAATFGWGTLELDRLLRARAHWLKPAGALAAALAAGVLVFLFVPGFVGSRMTDISSTHRALVYQALLRTDAKAAVAKAGGKGRILACGSVMTEGFQVPMVAYYLGVHTLQIEAPPATGPPPPAPNVIFQTRATRSAALLPIVHSWPSVRYKLVATTRTFRVFKHCGITS